MVLLTTCLSCSSPSDHDVIISCTSDQWVLFDGPEIKKLYDLSAMGTRLCICTAGKQTGRLLPKHTPKSLNIFTDTETKRWACTLCLIKNSHKVNWSNLLRPHNPLHTDYQTRIIIYLVCTCMYIPVLRCQVKRATGTSTATIL